MNTDDIIENAFTAASFEAGSYLESIGKFDLRTLSKSEWDHFCKVLINTYERESVPF